MKKMFYLFSVMVCLSACSKTPLEKLQSEKIYSDMTEKYWLNIFNEKSNPLWHQAVEYCIGHGDKPNCNPVNKIYMCGGDCLKKAPPMGNASEAIHFEAR